MAVAWISSSTTMHGRCMAMAMVSHAQCALHLELRILRRIRRTAGLARALSVGPGTVYRSPYPLCPLQTSYMAMVPKISDHPFKVS